MATARDLDAAFAAQPRERFLPEAMRAKAYYDGPLSIGFGQTNSQPRTVRAMLELLDVHPGQRCLDVGSGSGWTTALLATLVGPEGSVLGLERVPTLVADGASNVADAGLPWASVRTAAPGVLGAPDDAPFDRILVSAMASRLPLDLVAQLRPGGVLVVPVAGRMRRVVRGLPPRDDPRDAEVTEHGRYRFVPLVTDPA
ncbi:protein-L-isoaspartate O-methyltransferase [uncultured Phycicoccus sp.]|uniref:protein-L-isoaspartate O-methyltransferase family protein n=1 Tax=uncultured Phycicoccus sp. TaxID=661422 RepID=UPI0026163B2E|nr:protein-L-isoaspartate O-methyltransferase [uncultured Phycicoccus sp.]